MGEKMPQPGANKKEFSQKPQNAVEKKEMEGTFGISLKKTRGVRGSRVGNILAAGAVVVGIAGAGAGAYKAIDRGFTIKAAHQEEKKEKRRIAQEIKKDSAHQGGD